MSLANFNMLIHEILNKDPDIVPEEANLTILDIKSAIFMDNNGKDNKYTRHIDRRVHLVRNGDNWKMQNIEWCKRGMKLADIATKNVGASYLNPRMKYIMVGLENW